MYRLSTAVFVSLTWLAPTFAQDAAQNGSAPEAAAHEVAPSRSAQLIKRLIASRLALAGFSDIEMVPTSFLIRANDQGGNPVVLNLSPEAAAKLNETVGQSRDGADSCGATSEDCMAQPEFLKDD